MFLGLILASAMVAANGMPAAEPAVANADDAGRQNRWDRGRFEKQVEKLRSLGLLVTADAKKIDRATGEAAYFMFAERKEIEPRCQPFDPTVAAQWMENKPILRPNADKERIRPLLAALVEKLGYNRVCVYAADVHYGVSGHARFTLYKLEFRPKTGPRGGDQKLSLLLGDADYVLQLP